LNILEDAATMIGSTKEIEYGPPGPHFRRVAIGWSLIVGATVTAEQVARMMVWLKIDRAGGSSDPSYDTFVDMAGYAALAGELFEDARNRKVDAADPNLRPYGWKKT
jgi:Domain of unknown function (DUF6378)